MLEWLADHETALLWLSGASLVMFVATLLVVPELIVRIPADYFSKPTRTEDWSDWHHLPRLTLLVVRNLVGLLLLLAGLAMLILPGQGLLTLLVAFLVLDIPGKYRLERWFVSRSRVLRAVNWLRRRRGRPPLRVASSGETPRE